MEPKHTALKELLVQQIAKLYYAENQLVRALKMMAEKATHPELRQAFLSHRSETEDQVKRLATCFAVVQERPQAHYCQAIEGLLQNGNWLMHSLERGLVLDSALIGAAQQVELFEVASYRSICGLARQLNLKGVALVCESILYEELEADGKLCSIAEELGMGSGFSIAFQEEEEGAESEGVGNDRPIGTASSQHEIS